MGACSRCGYIESAVALCAWVCAWGVFMGVRMGVRMVDLTQDHHRASRSLQLMPFGHSAGSYFESAD